ncbi:hypothetical protein ANBU17_30940 [Anaerostipes butyraticus]|uniref:Uncharacterized protein n=1 Tax=Anaerostipes butyraticus TaxID=645466 RepID=A0A916Q9J0_9FIRM|nr:hypothetical protein ANBU17_30940 [Anaerostipes butyraticus]
MHFIKTGDHRPSAEGSDFRFFSQERILFTQKQFPIKQKPETRISPVPGLYRSVSIHTEYLPQLV